jgi:methionine sulfoxide reductase heme-binding subunit
MHTNLTPYLLWVTSRAAGFAALILASLAVSIGLLMSIKLLRRRGPDLRAVHEALSLATIAAIVVHGVSLLGDGYLHPSLADISIPFVSGYKTLWTSLGIVSGWSLALLGLGYYFRARIGVARWRSLHRLTALAWLGGLVHALGEGTDAGQAWFLAMVAIVVVPALALVATRYGQPARTRAGSDPRMRGSAGRRMRRPEELQAGRVPDHEAVELAAPLRPAGARLG